MITEKDRKNEIGRRAGRKQGRKAVAEQPWLTAGEKQDQESGRDQEPEYVQRRQDAPGKVRLLDGSLQQGVPAAAKSQLAGRFDICLIHPGRL